MSQFSASAVRPAVPDVAEIMQSLAALTATRLPIFLSQEQFSLQLSRWLTIYRQAKYQYAHTTNNETRRLFRDVSRAFIRQFCDCKLAHDDREFVEVCVSYIKLFKDPQPFIHYMEAHSIGQCSELYFAELGQYFEFNLGDRGKALQIYEIAIANPNIDGTRRLKKNRSRLLRAMALATDLEAAPQRGSAKEVLAKIGPQKSESAAVALAGRDHKGNAEGDPAGSTRKHSDHSTLLPGMPGLEEEAPPVKRLGPAASTASQADDVHSLKLPDWLSLDELRLLGFGELQRTDTILDALGAPRSTPRPRQPSQPLKHHDPYRLATKSGHFLSFILSFLNPQRNYTVYHVSGSADSPTAVHLRTPYYLPRIYQRFGRFYPYGPFNSVEVRLGRESGSAMGALGGGRDPADQEHAWVDFGFCPSQLFAPPLSFIEEADVLPLSPREGDTAVISLRGGTLALILTLEEGLGSGAFGKVFRAVLEQQPIAAGSTSFRHSVAKVAVKFFTRKKDTLSTDALFRKGGGQVRLDPPTAPTKEGEQSDLGLISNTFVREVYALAVLRERLPFLPKCASTGEWPDELSPEAINPYGRHVTGLSTGLANFTGLGALVMDYVPGLSLYHCIKRNLGYASSSRAPFEDFLLLRFVIDMLESVIFTISRDLVNTDIKIDNWIVAGYSGGDVYAPAPEKRKAGSKSRSRSLSRSRAGAQSVTDGTGPDDYYLVMCDLGKAVDAQLYITLNPAAGVESSAEARGRNAPSDAPAAGTASAAAGSDGSSLHPREYSGVTRPLHFSRESLTCIVPCPACTQETGWLFEPDLAGIASCIYMLIVGRSLKPDCIGSRGPPPAGEVSGRESPPPGHPEYFVYTSGRPHLWERYEVFEEAINRLLSWRCDQDSYEGQKMGCLRLLVDMRGDLQRKYLEEMKRRHPHSSADNPAE